MFIIVIMSATIKFNSKTGIMTVEVEDVSTNRILSAKLETAEATAP